MLETLALYGGSPVRSTPFPDRGSMGESERAAVNALFDYAAENGGTIGYGGPEEESYCREFSEYMGGGYADAVNSGTSAVYIALRALEIEPFSEIITGPLTDPGGLMPIPLNNLIPVIADAAPGSYNTDAAQIEKMITPLTRAVIVAHIGGEPADIENIVALAKKHGLFVIEDCAQAHDARLNGRLAGTFGDIAAFSTMFGKHHCTGGQGGIVFTKNEETYWKIRRASDRGKPIGLPEGATNCVAALNLNSNELACCIGRIQLRKLPGIVEARRKAVAFAETFLGRLHAVSVPELLPGAEHSYWFWRLKFNDGILSCDKNTYCDALRAEGLQVNASYIAAMPQLMDWFVERRVFGKSGYPWSAPEYKGDRDRRFPCPNALKAVQDHFNVTIHEGYAMEDMKDIIHIFEKMERALS